MKEQLINFETAKLAKEKGFDCRNIEIYEKESCFLDSVTQSLLQKWLREEHNIDVSVFSVRFTGHEDVSYYSYSVKGVSPVKDYKFKTFEQALEKGLQEALKLI